MIDVPISPGALALVQLLGLSGLIFIIWYGDMVKFRKLEDKAVADREAYTASVTRILQQYKDDVSEIKRLYENNSRLCDDWENTCRRQEKLYYETMSVISLNTQTMTKMVSQLERLTKEM